MELIFKNEGGVQAKLSVPNVRFDQLLEQMQTPSAKAAMAEAFNASPAELGRATLEQRRGAKKVESELAAAHESQPSSTPFEPLVELLRVSSPSGNYKTILVTSMSPGEGKTATAFTIAAALSKTGASVLIIAVPQTHTPHGPTMQPDADWRSFIKEGRAAFHPGLSQIKCFGGSNVCLFDSFAAHNQPLTPNNMTDLLQRVRDSFNFIIIDSPFFESSKHGLLHSSLIDGLLLVRGKSTSSSEWEKTVNQVTEFGIFIITVFVDHME